MQPKFIRFNQLADMTVSWDYHIHTKYTDGLSTIPEYIQCAIRSGLKEIAFTEHVRINSSWYNHFVSEVEAVRENYKGILTVFHGIETKVLNENGNLDASEEMLSRAEIILGAVHRYPGSTDANLFGKHQSPEDSALVEFLLSKALLENPHVDVLAHPGGIYSRRFNESLPANYLEAILHLANRNKKAVEINSSYLKDIPFNAGLFKEIDPLVSLGSDSHNINQLGDIIKFLKTQHVLP